MPRSNTAAIAHHARMGRRRRLSMMRDKFSSAGNGSSAIDASAAAQLLALGGEGRDARGDIRMIVQIGCDLRAPLGLERRSDIGVEIILGDRPLVHFTLRNATTFPGADALHLLLQPSRARDRRDITVPTGMLSTPAASA